MNTILPGPASPNDFTDLADTIGYDLLEHLRDRAFWAAYDGCVIEDAAADTPVLVAPDGRRVQVDIAVTVTPAEPGDTTGRTA